MLELKNVSFDAKTESGTKEIINNISVKIDERFVAFTGPNGGGKSTLAKLIAGIYIPTSGKIYLDGEDITDMSITCLLYTSDTDLLKMLSALVVALFLGVPHLRKVFASKFKNKSKPQEEIQDLSLIHI